MKKKIAFMILSSLMIAGASYFTSKNQVLLLDEVDAEAETVTHYDTQYLPRPTWNYTDVHGGYKETSVSYTSSYTIVTGPKFNFNNGTCTEARFDVYVTTTYLTCCMECKDAECDFGKDLNACNSVSGYYHPEHE